MDWKPITELQSVTCHMGSHSVTCHPTQVNAPALTPAIQTGTRFTYPGGMEGRVDLDVGDIPRWFTCPQTVTHPGTNQLIATRPGVEPTTSRSQVQRPSRYTTQPVIILTAIMLSLSVCCSYSSSARSFVPLSRIIFRCKCASVLYFQLFCNNFRRWISASWSLEGERPCHCWALWKFSCCMYNG